MWIAGHVGMTVPVCRLWFGHVRRGWVFAVLILCFAVGGMSLFEHVPSVLEADSQQQARQAVSLTVSRDTAAMNESETRRAALESLAENASDAVIAPLFWFALLGPLGAACTA